MGQWRYVSFIHHIWYIYLTLKCNDQYTAAVAYVNWAPGEPNNAGGEDCTEIYQTGQWNDLACRHGRAFICEKITRGMPSIARHGGMGGMMMGGCNRNYGCGKCGKCGCGKCNKCSRCGGCSGGCGGCGGGCPRRPSCGGSRCSKVRRKRRTRRRRRRRKRARRRRRARERRKWRKRMRRIRQRKDKQLRRALKKLKRKHRLEGRTYGWIADLLHRKLKFMKRSGQIASYGDDRRRRRRLIEDEIEEEEYVFIDVISRCKIVENINGKNYEICLNFNVGDEFLSVDIKYVNKKVLKEDNNNINYRHSIDVTQKHFDGDYEIMHDNDMWAFNPIHGNLGHLINKYESMDWHSFKHDNNNNKIDKKTYGEFDGFNDYIHYFDQYQFDFNPYDKSISNTSHYLTNDFIECSQNLRDLPFKMCMKTVNVNNNIDTLLYFEKDINDKYDIEETYSFQIKEYIDNGFEKNIFSFNNDNWDEIEIINGQDTSNGNDLKWIKKCSYRLIIGKVCIEQFDIYNNRASIKLKARNTKRENKHN